MSLNAQKMQTYPELSCSECNVSFSSAALLLKHFVFHVNLNSSNVDESTNKFNIEPDRHKAKIPDLFPITKLTNDREEMGNKRRNVIRNDDEEDSTATSESLTQNVNCDFEIDDFVNPLKFCVITMDDAPPNCSIKEQRVNKCNTRKYQCSYCSRRFGWSTDLKRHILTHTGERPFKCTLCSFTFTRKFLLQKHQNKKHSPNEHLVQRTSVHVVDKQIPQLKPISLVFKKTKQNSDISTIKGKNTNTKNLYQNGDSYEVINKLVLST